MHTSHNIAHNRFESTPKWKQYTAYVHFEPVIYLYIFSFAVRRRKLFMGFASEIADVVKLSGAVVLVEWCDLKYLSTIFVNCDAYN